MTPDRTRVLALDGLRFTAAFSVMVAHIGLWNVLLHGPLKFSGMSFATWQVLHLANFGMTLFFVLSGFVIHFNYRNIVGAPGGVSSFFLARWSRLYPLFFLAFVVGLAHLAIVNGLTEAVLRPAPLYLAYVDSWWLWPVNHAAAASAYQEPGLGVMWSLSTEAFFYCAYPFIAPVISKLRPRQTWGAIIFMGAAAAFVGSFVILRRADVIAAAQPWFDGVSGDQFIHWLAFNSPWIRIFEFLSGALAAQLYLSGFRFHAHYADAIATICLIAIAAMFVVMAISKSPLGALDTTLIAPCFAILCLTVTAPGSLVGRFFASRPMVWGGEGSYSLYLLHSWVLVELSKAKYHLYRSGVPIAWALASIVVAIALSRLCYAYYERPAMRFFRARGARLLGRMGLAAQPR